MITAAQIKAARELLDWSTAFLAKRTKRRQATIEAAEKGIASLHTLVALQQVLEAAGIEFIEDGGSGVRMRKPPA